LKSKRYVLTVLTGLGAAVAISVVKGLYSQTDISQITAILSDCFAVPGMLLILFGLLVICANGGAFDMPVYCVKRIFGGCKQDYIAYREGKRRREYAYLLICGACFFAVGALFLAMFYI